MEQIQAGAFQQAIIVSAPVPAQRICDEMQKVWRETGPGGFRHGVVETAGAGLAIILLQFMLLEAMPLPHFCADPRITSL